MSTRMSNMQTSTYLLAPESMLRSSVGGPLHTSTTGTIAYNVRDGARAKIHKAIMTLSHNKKTKKTKKTKKKTPKNSTNMKSTKRMWKISRRKKSK